MSLAWLRTSRAHNSRCTKSNAALAALHSASQLFNPARLEANVLPSLVQCFLDFVGDVDDLRCGDYIVPPMNKAIENLIEPEAVFNFAILVKITNLAPVQYLAFASERCDGTQVRVHGGINQAGIIVVALNIARAVEPVDP
jgi:hypothetical protein